MSYRVLARKYRPQSFDQIIGQAHVATTLINALKGGKVAHAYLFSGPRGVGKTTTARVLAKALNCDKGPTSTPCNACDSCERIAQGQEMVDVLEIDAASNRGIDEIRELRDNIRYAPARSRYKVYIIDEAHQITHDAFPALLKTLEEPPEHAVLILATTEHQKIPATILSRCQFFRFKPVSTDDITKHLEQILAEEKIKVEHPALERLARAAGGSVRDALSLLDQALAYSPKTLTIQQVEMLLGFLPEEFLQGFAAALLSRDPSKVLEWVKHLADEGWELPQFVRDFREHLRHAMVDQLSGGAKPAQLTLAGTAVSLPELLQMIKMFGQCLDEMRWNDSPRLVLELYSLRLTQPFVDAGALLKRIEGLEKGGPAPAATPSMPPPPLRGRIEVGGTPHPNLPPQGGKETIPAPKPAPIERSTDVAAPPKPDAVVEQWRKFITELWKKPTVASHLERAALRSAENGQWTISFADRFGLDAAQRAVAFMEETLAAVVGGKVRLRLVHEPRAGTEEAEISTDAPVAEAPASTAAKHEGVQKILQTFKGKIRPE